MTQSEKCRISVIGGGRMGRGIAFVFAHGGHQVSIFEPNAEVRKTLKKELGHFCDILDIDDKCLAKIVVQNDLAAAVKNSAFIIEAAPENLSLKQRIFKDLEEYAPREAILASNTSSIPISDIASDLVTSHRVIGAHFWNPPHLIELVEVIKGDCSEQAACDTAIHILNSVSMTPVLVQKDIPGCIGNRLQHAMKREAIALVAQGVCDAATLDTVVKKGFGARLHVMGPLEQSDLLGLDLTLAIHETLLSDLDNTAGPHALLQEKIRTGKIGADVGEGFRKWTDAEARRAREGLDVHLISEAKARYARRSQK